MPRVAICNICRTMERMPDPHPKIPLIPARMEWKSGETMTLRDDKGLPRMVPQYDPMLEDFVDRHGHNQDDRVAMQGGIEVYQVDQRTWDRIDIIAEIKQKLHEQTNEWYEERNQYLSDATECYNDHGNPDAYDGCPDYLDDSKLIGRGKFRDDDGGKHEIPRQFRQYLCYMCPFQHAYVQVEIRRKKGLYAS